VIPGRGAEGLPLGDNTNSSKDRLPAPPPLPEGWIALLDPNTKRYYYMHLQTQCTQWEFPKGRKPAPGPFIEPIQSSIASNYKQPPDATSFPIPSTADSTTAELVGPPTVTAELPYAATAARSSVGPVYRWWVPAEGISRQVITTDIHIYLGSDALVKPGPGVERDKVQLSLRNILIINMS
jgi:WW domain